MENLKQQLVKTAKKLKEKGFSPGFSGNISIKCGRHFLITPSGLSLDDFKEEDVVLVDENCKIIDGTRKPSSEIKLHFEVYKNRPDIGAIIHCHSPKASAFAVADIPLSQPILAENVFHLGEIPVAKYYLPSSVEVAKETAKYFDSHDVVLMQNHGVVVGAKTIKEAYYKMETVEYTAEVILNAKILGNITELTPDEVQEVLELKASFGK